MRALAAQRRPKSLPAVLAAALPPRFAALTRRAPQAVLGGKASPSAADVKAILTSGATAS